MEEKKELVDDKKEPMSAHDVLPDGFVEWAFGGYDRLYELGPVESWNELHANTHFIADVDMHAITAINRMIREWHRSIANG